MKLNSRIKAMVSAYFQANAITLNHAKCAGQTLLHIRPLAICKVYLPAPSVTEIIILCDQTEIIGEILAILAEQMLSSPFLLEVSQCLEEAILTQVQFIALPIMGSAITPVSL
ncbi:hypothetical protein WM94_14390 [Pseudomonas sp. ABFPK]|nr:hypothetical protein WM94_14390 [Pseudomonas sp. ABFPK]